jgi:hypothetical protein
MDNETVYILLRMRHWRLADEPEVYESWKEAAEAFETYTGHSWDEVESLTVEAGGDVDQILGGIFAGTRILTVEVPSRRSLGATPPREAA